MIGPSIIIIHPSLPSPPKASERNGGKIPSLSHQRVKGLILFWKCGNLVPLNLAICGYVDLDDPLLSSIQDLGK